MAEYRKRRRVGTITKTSSQQQRIFQELEEIQTRLQSLDDIKMELSQLKDIVDKKGRRRRRRLVLPIRRFPSNHSGNSGQEEHKRHSNQQGRPSSPNTGGGISGIPSLPGLSGIPNNLDMGKIMKLMGDPAVRNLLKGMMK